PLSSRTSSLSFIRNATVRCGTRAIVFQIKARLVAIPGIAQSRNALHVFFGVDIVGIRNEQQPEHRRSAARDRQNARSKQTALEHLARAECTQNTRRKRRHGRRHSADEWRPSRRVLSWPPLRGCAFAVLLAVAPTAACPLAAVGMPSRHARLRR